MSGSPCVSVGYLTAKLIKCLVPLQKGIFIVFEYLTCMSLYKLKVYGYNIDKFSLCDVDNIVVVQIYSLPSISAKYYLLVQNSY